MSSYFLLKCNIGNLNSLTLVNYECVSYSGDCYLVSSLEDNLKREWVMYYNLYKLVDKDEYNNNWYNNKWYYNEEYDNIMRKKISEL
jgi:hypothetical protein